MFKTTPFLRANLALFQGPAQLSVAFSAANDGKLDGD